MRALSAAIISAAALLGLGLAGVGIGLRYQHLEPHTGTLVYIRWGQLDTPMMLVVVVLLASLVVGLATMFLGLAYHHERRHFERTRAGREAGCSSSFVRSGFGIRKQRAHALTLRAS